MVSRKCSDYIIFKHIPKLTELNVLNQSASHKSRNIDVLINQKDRREFSSKTVFPLEEPHPFADRKHVLHKITIYFRCNESDRVLNLKTPLLS